MKKIILLSILCFLLTGCTINYNLKIEDGYFIETIKGNVLTEEIKKDNTTSDENLFYKLLSSKQPALTTTDNLIYNKTISQNKDSIDYTYSFKYDEYTFNNSRLLNECFEHFSFIQKDNMYTLLAKGDFYCSYTDEIKINIKTDYPVIINNADEIKNNTYTWNIKNNKTKDLELYISIDKSNTYSNNQSKWDMIKTACFFILIILSAICIFITKKKEKQY